MRRHDVQPIDVIFVMEGMNAKAPRLAISNLYKSKREDKPMSMYQQFTLMRDQVVKVFRSVGALVITQDNAEGDDVLGWLAENTKEDLVVASNDGDLAILNFTNAYGAKVRSDINGNVGQNPYGPWPLQYLTLYKAMVGDSTDTISGIVGFGDKAWEQFDHVFGEAGMDEMLRLAELGSLDELADEAQKNKMIGKIFEGRADFLRSYRLAKLHPEWVNTLHHPLKFLPGLNHGRQTDERFKPFQAARRLVTAENWESFVPWALNQLSKMPWYALDIETSTPPESDDWLATQDAEDAVDVMGSKLTGMSLTFGINMQYTVYISVDHAKTTNVTSAQLLTFIKQIKAKPVIHNTMFEGPVLYNEWGADWKDNGFEGFLPNWLDTKLEASYVDENGKLGLKGLSKRWLEYDQVDYGTVTRLEVKAPDLVLDTEGYATERKPSLPYKLTALFDKEVSPAAYEDVEVDADGNSPVESGLDVAGIESRLIKPAVTELYERYQRKMNELTAQEAFDYGCDDTMCTAAFHNFAMTFMSLEGTWDVYLQVEIDSSYTHAQSFVNGVDLDLPKLQELILEDTKSYEEAKKVLDTYLISKGWEGTVVPQFTVVDATAIKTAYQCVFGVALDTRVRTPSKILGALEESAPTFVKMCASVDTLNELIKQNFKAAPIFNPGSPKQMANLLYNVMAMPVRVYNKPTDKMKAEGLRQGTPKTDSLAIAYALMECSEEVKVILTNLRVMKMVETRRSLYYEPYPYFVHWKTGKVHSNHNQCGTNTRRASSAKPNLQQQSKHGKVEGFDPRVREVIVPHKRKAVIVSLDFASQELRVIADYSKDANMLACFVGDDLKDMHSLTAVGIAQSKRPDIEWNYRLFEDIRAEPKHELNKFAKECRNLGKKTNFTTEYGAQAPKLAVTLLIPEPEAQAYIDAKEAAFPEAASWKLDVIEEVRRFGYVTTMMGARRHLAAALTSSDRYEASKAERQAVNFKVQGSSAEMTKLAEGRMWKARIEQRFDCRIIAAIHDEVVVSIAVDDLFECIKALHECMVAPYGGMTVPIKSSISIGPNFGKQIEVGDVPDLATIKKALMEIGMAKEEETA